MNILHRFEVLDGLHRLPTDADDPKTWNADRNFLPIPSHARIGGEGVWIIVGARGMGKSTLARVSVGDRELTDEPLFGLFSAVNTVRVDGWSRSGRHIQPEHGAPPLHFWVNDLLRAVGLAAAKLEGRRPQRGRVPSRQSFEALVVRDAVARLFDLDAAFHERRWQVVVVYDGVEALEQGDDFARELIALWADLGPRLRAITPKIFLRDDLRDRVSGRTGDLAKLSARTMTLTWSEHDVWRLLLFVFANSSKEARALLEAQGFPPGPAPKNGTAEWYPPDVVPEQGPASRDVFATLLAGRFMGATASKGYTFRWITRHLADGNGAIAPRSVVNLLLGSAKAALDTPVADGPLFTGADIREGLRHTARRRAEELVEERDDVVRILERLAGQTVPIDGADLALHLFGPTGLPLDGAASAVLHDLQRLGVLTRRHDGRYDVPDLYRLGYDVKRRGGTPLSGA